MTTTQEGTVLQIDGTYYHVKLTTMPDPIFNVKNTSGLEIEVGDKVIIDYVEDISNPVIIGVYDKTTTMNIDFSSLKTELDEKYVRGDIKDITSINEVEKTGFYILIGNDTPLPNSPYWFYAINNGINQITCFGYCNNRMYSRTRWQGTWGNYKLQSNFNGSVIVTPAALNTTYTVNVTYPHDVAPASSPRAFCNVLTGNIQNYEARVSAQTTSGCTITYRQIAGTAGTAVTITWVAFGI